MCTCVFLSFSIEDMAQVSKILENQHLSSTSCTGALCYVAFDIFTIAFKWLIAWIGHFNIDESSWYTPSCQGWYCPCLVHQWQCDRCIWQASSCRRQLKKDYRGGLVKKMMGLSPCTLRQMNWLCLKTARPATFHQGTSQPEIVKDIP